MLRPDVQASFSDLWYRVVDARPRLSPHARIIRQHYGPVLTYIVEDPAGGHYYRLSEPAYFFLGLLDGRTSVDEAWEACCAQLGDNAPTQRECMNLLAQLQLFGLLIGDQPLAGDMIEQRLAQARSQRFQKRSGRFMFPSVPLINPEGFLERTLGFWRLVFSRVGLVALALTLATALLLVVPRYREFGSELNSILEVRNLVYMSVLFVLIRAIHEFGHAGACKAMGGRCTEIGVILIAWIIPLPYCDASSAWRFPEVSRRVLVSAGGMLVEFFLAGIAAIVWALTDPADAQVLHALAFNAMVLSSVTTLLFNLNPLLRYDGYYILSDVLGVPNLAQRSRTLWRFLIERWVFGMRRNTPPATRDRAEFWLLAIYGVLSPPYRILIGLSIIFIIAQQYLTIGLVLAGVLGVVWFCWPVIKGAAFLATSPRLIGRRVRAASISLSVVGAMIVLIGFVPMPSAGYAHGTVEAGTRAILRAGEEGFVARVLVRAGQEVHAGQTLIELENPGLETERVVAQSAYREALLQRDLAIELSPQARAIAEERVRLARASVDLATRRVESLRVVSPIAGRAVAPGGTGIDLENLVGAFVERGQAIVGVAALDSLRVRAQMSDREFAHVFPDARATLRDDAMTPADKSWARSAVVRVRGRSAEGTPARVTGLGGAGFRRLEDESLSTQSAGPFALDPSDASGQATMLPLFSIELTPAVSPAGWQPGLRAKVRFDLEPAPIAAQAWRWARRFLADKVLR